MTPETGTNTAPPSLNAQQYCLLLDFDGTLVDIVERPEDVVIDARLSELLERLRDLFDSRLAIVSGRSIAQLEGFFGTTAQDLALVGSHGAEIRLTGSVVTSPSRPDALDDAEVFFKQAFSGNSKMVIEPKSFGVAIHYRLDPSMEGMAIRMAAKFANESGLELQHGKMMVELRTTGHDKGSAIKALLSAAPFAGYTPIFIGDDLTDEPGFAVCASAGGFGIIVGPQRKTAALYRLDHVTAVRQWLEKI